MAVPIANLVRIIGYFVAVCQNALKYVTTSSFKVIAL